MFGHADAGLSNRPSDAEDAIPFMRLPPSGNVCHTQGL